MDFKKLNRLLAPFIVDGVLAVKQSANDRLVEVLDEIQFVTRSVNQLPDSIVLELQILDVNVFYKMLAGEANKFLLASRVSHARAIQVQENNASWQAVEHYYSAYYAIHYLLRLTGVSLTNLDARSMSVIKRNALGIPMPQTIPEGLYVMSYDDASNILTLKKNTKKSSGGSHKDAWRLWEELVEKIKNQTETDPAEYVGVAVELAAHKKFLVKSTSKYNPPEIRGEINYQFKGGSWIFEERSQSSIGRIQRSISLMQPESIATTVTPEALIASNKFIIGLAKSVFKNASEKYPKSICRSLENKYSIYMN